MDSAKINTADLTALCHSIIDAATRFYSDPENVKAFYEWQKEKEEKRQC